VENLIETIKAKSAQIKEKRQQFLAKLLDLQKTLAAATEDVSIYAQSKSIDLQMIGPDDWIYGRLTYGNGTVKIAHRSTEDDYIETMRGVEDYSQTFKVQKMEGVPIEWLEKLSSEEIITSLLNDIKKQLDDVSGKTNMSMAALDKVLSTQSCMISDGVINELKIIKDESLHRDWLKARNQIQIDPSDSIARSSSYLESVCYKILNDLNIPLPNDKDVEHLIGEVVKNVPFFQSRDAENDFKKLFKGIKTIFQAIGTLRTHFSTAHGSIPGSQKLDEDCARFVSDAAGAVSVFVLKRYKLP
jgi:hypothetical protein